MGLNPQEGGSPSMYSSHDLHATSHMTGVARPFGQHPEWVGSPIHVPGSGVGWDGPDYLWWGELTVSDQNTGTAWERGWHYLWWRAINEYLIVLQDLWRIQRCRRNQRVFVCSPKICKRWGRRQMCIFLALVSLTIKFHFNLGENEWYSFPIEMCTNGILGAKLMLKSKKPV